MPAETTTQPQPKVRPQVKPQAKHEKKKEKANKKPRAQTEVQVWVEGLTDDGNMYYYNTVTGGEDTRKSPLSL